MDSAKKSGVRPKALARAKGRRFRRDRSPPTDLVSIRHEHLGWLLERADRLFARLVSSEVHARGFDDVRLVHVALIRSIEEHGTRISEIAKRAGMSKQATGQLVTEFVSFGYIQVIDHPSDGRVKIAVYTAKGKRLLGACADAIKDTEKLIERSIGGPDFAKLKGTLQRLIISAEG